MTKCPPPLQAEPGQGIPPLGGVVHRNRVGKHRVTNKQRMHTAAVDQHRDGHVRHQSLFTVPTNGDRKQTGRYLRKRWLKAGGKGLVRFRRKIYR